MSAAGFWQRYVAWSLDAAIIAIPVTVIVWPHWQSSVIGIAEAFDAFSARFAALAVDGLRSAEHPLLLAREWIQDEVLSRAISSLESALVDAVTPGFAAFVLLAAMYWVAFECSPWQATPGKRALNLVVTDLRDQRLGLFRAVWRHLAGLLSWLTLNAGHALAALPPQKRALHDYIAGTRVMQRGVRPLPVWARAWLLLQALAMLAATAWLMLRIQGALQLALYRLL
ncbi:MAG: RDD family protein [Lysobacter sp.]|nr:RDD family protein [Lysobacter sp.]